MQTPGPSFRRFSTWFSTNISWKSLDAIGERDLPLTKISISNEPLYVLDAVLAIVVLQKTSMLQKLQMMNKCMIHHVRIIQGARHALVHTLIAARL